MTRYEVVQIPDAAVLHVFEQDGGWHWGITVPRSAGSGFKVISYSEHSFPAEAAARHDGDRALRDLSATGLPEHLH
jgi:hypothetical protein